MSTHQFYPEKVAEQDANPGMSGPGDDSWQVPAECTCHRGTLLFAISVLWA